MPGALGSAWCIEVVHRGRPARTVGSLAPGYLAVARAGSLGPTRSYWRVSRSDTPRFAHGFATTRLEPWAHEALVASGAVEASGHGGGGGRRQAVQ